MRKVFLSTVLIFSVFYSVAQTEKTKIGHFVIRYDKDVEAYALSSTHILNFVWEKLDELGFKPPKKIKFNLVKSDRNVLFKDRDKPIITLEYTTLDPSKISQNLVYGLCHEMGHLCMFNITPNKNNWMSIAYREGWANIFGESMTTLLYEKYGLDVWHNPYDYLARLGVYITMRTQAIESGENIPDMFISDIFWKMLVDEKEMDKIPFFFRQIKSNKVRNPNADKKFRAELVKLNVSSDFLNYFDQNKQIMIRHE